jgi:hypothetical protein
VPHTVRVKPLLAEIRNIPGNTGKTPGEDVADPEPSQGPTTVIQNTRIWRETLENVALVPRKNGIGHPMAAVLMLRRNVELEIPETAIGGALARQLHIPNNFTFG